MPNASTGGTEDRAPQAGARFAGRLGPNGVGVEIDGQGRTTFTTSAGTIPDLVTEVRAEPDRYSYRNNTYRVTYTFESGRTLTVPSDWRSPGLVSTRDFTPVAGGPVRVAACTCDFCRGYPQEYRVGGFIRREDPWDDPTRTRLLADEQVRRETQERLERRERKAQAGQRAEETLKKILTPDELQRYEKTGSLIVTGSDGRRYAIGSGIVSNVLLLDDDGDTMASLCCHPDMCPTRESGDYEYLPERDAHIAQVLYLRHDLDRFWDTANVEWYSDNAREEYERHLRGRRRLAARINRVRARIDS